LNLIFGTNPCQVYSFLIAILILTIEAISRNFFIINHYKGRELISLLLNSF